MKIPNKKYVYGDEARELLLKGVKELSDSVSVTIGARGQNVIFQTAMYTKPTITNDGVTIAREGKMEEPVPDMAMQLIKQASFRTNNLAGDGTTTTIVLADAIVSAAFAKLKTSDVSSVQMRRSLLSYMDNIISSLKEKSKKIRNVDDLCRIATISCQDEKLGRMLGDLVYSLGAFGAVDLEEGGGSGISINRERGYRIDNGVKEGHWITRVDGVWGPKLSKAKILISIDPIDNSKHLIDLLSSFVEIEENKRVVHHDKLLIIAEKLSPEILQLLFRNSKGQVHNGIPGFLEWAWVQPPKFGERRKRILEDLAAATHGVMVDKEQGVYLNRLVADDLGQADFLAGEDRTVIKPSDEEGVKERIKHIESLISATKSEPEIEAMRKRIACLNGEVATVSYNAPTDADKKELKLRLEDALSASKAALEEGYVAGGGIALLNARRVLMQVEPKTKEEEVALQILIEACVRPFWHILNNADHEDIYKLIDELDKLDDIGVNVLTGEQINMIEGGVIDPLKVVRLALENAVSSAGVLMTTGCAIVLADEKKEDK